VRLRWLLAGLIAGALLPVVAFAALTVARVAREERASIERRLSEAADALADALDHEALASIRSLEALGGMLPRDGGDLATFAGEARRLDEAHPAWLGVVLSTPGGTPVLDTRLRGAPPSGEGGTAPRGVVASGAPLVGDLVALEDERLASALTIPIDRDGKVRWMLSALVSADAVGLIAAARAGAKGEWTRTVVDRAGRVVARSRSPERYVGKAATGSFLAATRASPGGVYQDVTLDGARAYVAFSHAAVSGWTTAVVVPRDVLDAPTRRSLLATAGVGLAAVVLGAGGAFVVSRRVSRAIGSAASGAQALALGERPAIEPAGIAELAQLSDALARSADLLAARARERDEGVARAEAARAEAQAASSTKDEFLAMLGHELRNPLSPIVTALHLLEQRGLANTREHAIIRRQVAHLLRLVEDLLDVSRITRGKVTLQVEPVEATAFVEKAVEMASHLLEQRRHRLTVDVPPGLVVRGDPARLAQIVANLLTNAARYTPPAGNVEVRATREGERIRVAVRDDGCGLAPELRAAIFDPFVQAPRTPDRQEGGLGLGLALVRNLVALHGGRVEALSDGPGKGSTFVVELPVAAAAAERRVEAPPSRRTSGGSLRVLLVDDNADALALLAEVVARAGHDVRTAADGPTALEVAARFAPHVAVLDLGLPVMDGYELAARLRERLAARAPAFVAMTGYGQPKDHERSRGLGFRRHLVKPADPAALLEELERIVAERRAPRAVRPC
jgi:signal transduction histidine kinase/ActR/RegA family two-component response regulator